MIICRECFVHQKCLPNHPDKPLETEANISDRELEDMTNELIYNSLLYRILLKLLIHNWKFRENIFKKRSVLHKTYLVYS